MAFDDALRPGSFRGARFFLERERQEGGRRLAVAEIAYGDGDPIVEDFGRRTRQMDLTVYTAGEDRMRGPALALASALDGRGGGRLVLPLGDPLFARCVSWRYAAEKDRIGYVAFDVQFIPAGPGATPFGLATGFGPVDGLMRDGAALLTTALAQALR